MGIDTDELEALVHFSEASAARPRWRGHHPRRPIGQPLDASASGVACSYRRGEDGSRQIYSFQYPGDFCDLYRYVLPEQDETMAVQALTECSVATIDYADIEQLLVQRPGWAWHSGERRCSRPAFCENDLSNTRRGSALRRVANLLCEQLARREAIGMTDPVVPITQVDVADAAALSIVHVNRTDSDAAELVMSLSQNHARDRNDRPENSLRISAASTADISVCPQLVSGWAIQIDPSP